jgi:hypothetical protein
MKVWFDTEFTGLHKNTTLISIGLVNEYDETFYAEFTDYDESQCDEWIQENVINHLQFRKMKASKWAETFYVDEDRHTRVRGNKEYVKEQLEKWMNVNDGEIQLISDVCHYDMVLFIDIFGSAFDIPDNVCASCHDINQDIALFYGVSESKAFDISREEIVGREIPGEKHNSLYDARVIKAIYYKLHKY